MLLIISISNVVRAQDCNLRLSGHVEDTDTRDKLTDATVTIVELNRQMMTDSTGDFAFDSLCTGNYTIRISHVHCETKEQKVQLNKKKHLDFFLPHSKNTLTEVIVEARKEISNTGFKKELSGKAMQETKGLSLSEALNKINGVTMLQTGSTISKPVIHGLHSNRILTINGLIEYKIIGLHIECNDQKKATFICLHCGQFNAITIKEEFLEIPKKISIEKVIFEGFCEQCSSDF